MDISKEYILMCKKAEKIQRVYFNDIDFVVRGQHEVGDYLTHETHTGSGVYIPPYIFKLDMYGNNRSPDMHDVWLPRQDQLQDMLIYSNSVAMIYHFNKYLGCMDGSIFKSMEQLWLAFVMKDKFNKKWDGNGWVK